MQTDTWFGKNSSEKWADNVRLRIMATKKTNESELPTSKNTVYTE